MPQRVKLLLEMKGNENILERNWNLTLNMKQEVKLSPGSQYKEGVWNERGANIKLSPPWQIECGEIST